MNCFAAIDFRDDNFSRQRVINKNSWQGLARGKNIRFAEAIANYTIISRTRVIQTLTLIVGL